MNNTYILLVLVNILTKAEKRYFHLYANLQNGDQMYLALFNLPKIRKQSQWQSQLQ